MAEMAPSCHPLLRSLRLAPQAQCREEGRESRRGPCRVLSLLPLHVRSCPPRVGAAPTPAPPGHPSIASPAPAFSAPGLPTFSRTLFSTSSALGVPQLWGRGWARPPPPCTAAGTGRCPTRTCGLWATAAAGGEPSPGPVSMATGHSNGPWVAVCQEGRAVHPGTQTRCPGQVGLVAEGPGILAPASTVTAEATPQWPVRPWGCRPPRSARRAPSHCCSDEAPPSWGTCRRPPPQAPPHAGPPAPGHRPFPRRPVSSGPGPDAVRVRGPFGLRGLRPLPPPLPAHVCVCVPSSLGVPAPPDPTCGSLWLEETPRARGAGSATPWTTWSRGKGAPVGWLVGAPGASDGDPLHGLALRRGAEGVETPCSRWRAPTFQY